MTTKTPLQQKEEEELSKQEMVELMETLLDYTYKHLSDDPLEFSLSMRASSTCWNSILTKEDVDKLVFTGKCGECKEIHEYPKCDKCKTTRMQSGKCQSCCYIKPEEEYYSSYCGNSFQRHELPNCVECQQYRLKPGRCTNCGSIEPDDIQWKDTCLDEDNNYERLMQPVLNRRTLDIKINSRKFKTYDNCPLCRQCFHSAKACIFRKHALHFNDMKQQIQQLTHNLKNIQGKKPTEVLLHKITLQREREVDISDEEDTDENGQPIFTFDNILKALQHIQAADSEDKEE